jgi:hypothetical protein
MGLIVFDGIFVGSAATGAAMMIAAHRHRGTVIGDVDLFGWARICASAKLSWTVHPTDRLLRHHLGRRRPSPAKSGFHNLGEPLDFIKLAAIDLLRRVVAGSFIAVSISPCSTASGV